jgi:predicted enzyme related to lactoylglutathione lyase
MDHTIVHFEIPADDPERATKFYRELFGWEIQKWASEGGPEYWMVSTVPTDGKGMPTRPGVNGGLIRRQHPGHPPVNYIGVESVDEYAKKAKRLGAQEIVPKTPVKGMGWFVWLKDTEGNVFAIWQTDEKAA